MKLEEDLLKLSLAANSATQDVQTLLESDGALSKDELTTRLTRARACVQALKEKIREVETNMALVDKETERMSLESLIKKWKLDLSQLNAILRRVNLSSLAILERQEKAALMGHGESMLTARKRIVDKQTAVKGSGSITDSLMSTSRMMAEHLQRSSDTIETLSNSSKNITGTHEELKNMQGHIKNARSLLTKYARKEMTDKLFIFLAVVFFLATVLYILKKRLWSTTAGIDTYSQSHDNSHDQPLVV